MTLLRPKNVQTSPIHFQNNDPPETRHVQPSLVVTKVEVVTKIEVATKTVVVAKIELVTKVELVTKIEMVTKNDQRQPN